ncbi:REP-associated tyrosine transposase [Rodentibacter trehalosifermentans]|uniref:Transposase n=1 Tax=Rodentibacter trehalosifermentans TaxID=1908263 RepID=A0A1V3IZF7_9PAST|nr:transposase [Rodentibacter trehalosifermentans]OOF46406.1 transposase [Rodentibacter trehalosifermentans]OOF47847.1 transposase [Rodentibacter trehalosifermentans]OOF53653.1 transposase [Rodentibacter trehalosifermentans]
MSFYRRNYIKGGTFFFTVKLADPKSHLLIEHIDLLREAYQFVKQKYPFKTEAICILPNHIHCIWTLPENDSNYSLRLRLLKTRFSSHFKAKNNLSPSKQRRKEKGIWQRRFYEHTIRDDKDFENCVNYIHYNPVKHGWVEKVKDWQFSTFHQYVKNKIYPENWG